MINFPLQLYRVFKPSYAVVQSDRTSNKSVCSWMCYLGDGDSGQLLHRLGEAGHDVQHLS